MGGREKGEAFKIGAQTCSRKNRRIGIAKNTNNSHVYLPRRDYCNALKGHGVAIVGQQKTRRRGAFKAPKCIWIQNEHLIWQLNQNALKTEI